MPGARTKKRFRINYMRLALMLLCVSMIAYGVYLLSAGMYAAKEGDDLASQTGSNAGDGTEPDGWPDSVEAADPAETEGNPFAAFYYYEPDKQGRYENYADKNPALTFADVVWRVNADLDRFAYTNITTVTDFTPPVLLNKYRKLPDDYVPSDLVKTSSGQQMTAETRAAYEALRDAAGAAGRRISANAAYKSVEYQKGAYNKSVMEHGKEEADDFEIRAGHSEHHLGTAIDLAGSTGTPADFAGTPEAEWVAENAWEYGFIVRYAEANQDVTGYPPEPWHITWVGTEVAATMRERGIDSLEEYTVKYVNHNPSKNH